MKHSLKQQIALATKNKMALQGLSLRVAETKSGVNKTALGWIIKDKWQTESISNRIWLNLAEWTDTTIDAVEWVQVPLKNLKVVHNVCADAQQESIMLMLSHRQGSGKSYGLTSYADSRPKNTFYIECKEHWTRKVFLTKVMRSLGIAEVGESIDGMVNRIVNHLKACQKPLLIIDEADELKENVFRFIKTFYNELENRCGFVIAGGLHLKNRVFKGVRLQKQSYMEIFSRGGSEFIPLHAIDVEAVKAFCLAQGIEDNATIKAIINGSNAAQGADLRQVKRLVHDARYRQKNAA